MDKTDVKIDALKPLFGGVREGCGPLVMAGPCSAESREQTLRTARELSETGIRVFRAGVWKPRTKPGSFEGIGVRALAWLAEVRDKTGMLPMTEIATPVHLRQALRAAYAAFCIRFLGRLSPAAGLLPGKALPRLFSRNDDKEGDCIGGTARCKEN